MEPEAGARGWSQRLEPETVVLSPQKQRGPSDQAEANGPTKEVENKNVERVAGGRGLLLLLIHSWLGRRHNQLPPINQPAFTDSTCTGLQRSYEKASRKSRAASANKRFGWTGPASIIFLDQECKT